MVIAQVERITTAGSIPPQQVRIPGALVDWVVVAPDQWQTTQTQYDPAISGELRRPVDQFEMPEWGLDKVIARRAALELIDGEAVNLGFGISALVPRILLEEGFDGRVTWVIEQGAVGGMPLLGFQFGCAANAQAIMPSPAQFTYFQGGGFDRCLLSFLQVDAEGNVNVSRLRGKPHVTAGAGGFVDITTAARNLVFSGAFCAGRQEIELENGELTIREDGKVAKFVPEVEHVTFSGRMARERGQNVTFVTERCVIRLHARRTDRDRDRSGHRSGAGCPGPRRDPTPRQPGPATDGRAALPSGAHGSDAARRWRADRGGRWRRAVEEGRCQLAAPEALLVLSAREALTAEAVFERMFPADEHGPGAREIGVVTYLDRALAGAYREHLPVYRNGLALLDSASQARFGVRFASAEEPAQDDLIGDLERGEIPGWVVPDQGSFFELLRSHLQEGLFSDPAYGGNRDKLGWRFLGHPGVWLENSAEENLSPDPVTKGGRIQSLADVAPELHAAARS